VFFPLNLSQCYIYNILQYFVKFSFFFVLVPYCPEFSASFLKNDFIGHKVIHKISSHITKLFHRVLYLKKYAINKNTVFSNSTRRHAHIHTHPQYTITILVA